MRQRPAQRPTAIGKSIPAPTGGWNTESPLSDMPLNDALILDNWIPRPGYVEIRRGFVGHSIGAPAAVESMLVYRGTPTGDKLFAASNGGIYDVTVGGSFGAAAYSGCTSNRWAYLNYANAAGAWLLGFNGSDTPISYNGTSFAAMSITGSSGSITLTPSKLFTAAVHKGRILALETGTLHCWFPAAGAIAGAYQLLDLGSVFSRGGQLVAVGTWGWPGIQPDDFVSFITNQGQIAVYQGIDPSDATNWSLVGVYDVGRPLGPKALMQYGSDLMLVTTDGIIAMSQVLQADRTKTELKAITTKIAGAFASAVRAYRSNYGWQGLFYPGDTTSTNQEADGGGLAIFNIPTATLSTSIQFVQNTLTGAWCRFPTGINSFCWELANDCIYFGSTSGVYQWDYGASDNGQPITFTVKSAFTNFGTANTKQFTMVRPLLNTVSLVQPTLDVNVDYNDSNPTAMPVTVPASASQAAIRYNWTGATGIGYVGAVKMQIVLYGDPAQSLLATGNLSDTLGVTTTDILAETSGLPFDVPCQLIGYDLMYQNGGAL